MKKVKKSSAQKVGTFLGYLFIIALGALAISVLILLIVGVWYLIVKVGTDAYRFFF